LNFLGTAANMCFHYIVSIFPPIKKLFHGSYIYHCTGLSFFHNFPTPQLQNSGHISFIILLWHILSVEQHAKWVMVLSLLKTMKTNWV